MVEIIAHRGLWTTPSEQNSQRAIIAALAAGFGVELDLRDLNGALVISHDPPRAGALRLDDLLEAAHELMSHGRWAINIKADGLQHALAPYREQLAPRAFVFDASVPELRKYQQLGWPTFARFSEYEPSPSLLDGAAGVWIDCFVRDVHAMEAFAPWSLADKQLCFVSPELHGRPPQACWAWLRNWTQQAPSKRGVALCTDLPERAQEYFG